MSTQQPCVERILARRVIHRGEVYGLSLVTISGNEVTVEPFTHETANTTFYSGTLRILRAGYRTLNDWHRPGTPIAIVKE